MRFLPSLLLAATVTLAIPLHKGETWTWEVSRRGIADTLSATVLDSSRDDSDRPLWVLEVASSSGGKDTASILVQNGRQAWKKTSRWIPWTLEDVAPWQVGPVSRALALDGGDLFSSVAIEDPTSIQAWATSFAPLIDFGGTVYRPRPRGVWDGAHGLLRYEDADGTWTLRSHHRQPITLPPASLRLPPVGTSWTWQEAGTQSWFAQENPPLRHVRILAQDSDSELVVRVSIQESLDGDTVLFHCRIPRPSPDQLQGCPEYARDWIVDWRELPSVPDDMVAVHVRDSSVIEDRFSFMVSYRVGTIRHERIREDGIASSKILTTYEQELVTDDNQYHASPLRTTHLVNTTLLEVNGTAVSLRSGPSTRKPAVQPSLLPLLRRWPDQPLTWHDLSGRSGTLRASDILKPSASPRLLILDATFPDGTRWKGKFLTGSRN